MDRAVATVLRAVGNVRLPRSPATFANGRIRLGVEAGRCSNVNWLSEAGAGAISGVGCTSRLFSSPSRTEPFMTCL
jgi:hypothetical protein